MTRTPVEATVAAEDGAPAVAEVCELGEADAGLVASPLPVLLFPARLSRNVLRSKVSVLPAESPQGWRGVGRRGRDLVGRSILLGAGAGSYRKMGAYGSSSASSQTTPKTTTLSIAGRADPGVGSRRYSHSNRMPSALQGVQDIGRGDAEATRRQRPAHGNRGARSSTFCRLTSWPRRRPSGSTPGRTRSFSS